MGLVTPEKIQTFQNKLYAAAKQDKARRFHQLYDKIYRPDILRHAWRIARANKGTPGVDGQTFDQIEAKGLDEWLEKLRQDLHTRTYRPEAVKRVMIPKIGGGERPLGIPTIRDRVAQTAAKLILTPIFEADFEDCAYGYRPGRSAEQAVEKVRKAMDEGYTDVVDADLSKYFDTIPHDALMKSLARRISDKHVLHLIKMWLTAPVQETDENGRPRMSGGRGARQGTPQGGVISPLLANIYMHRFLRYFYQTGKHKEYRARIVNYADDFVILSRGKAQEALNWTRGVMEKIGLQLNESKTCVRDAEKERFDFLGYTCGPEVHRRRGEVYLTVQPSAKSIRKLKDGIQEVLRRGKHAPWPLVRNQLNLKLRGWANYFRIGTRLLAFREVDNYADEQVRSFLRRRHKVASRATRQFPSEKIFGELGVQRLRSLHLGNCVGRA